MSNVIEVKFRKEQKEGHDVYYLLDENDKLGGVSVSELGAFHERGVVYIGELNGNEIESPVMMSIEQMNIFCMGWLCLHCEEFGGEEDV